jgi:hypothetical protein
MIILNATCTNGAIALNDPLPKELKGKSVEIFIREVSRKQKVDRRAVMRFPITERRLILGQQAEVMVKHYQQDLTWHDWTSFSVERG